MSSPALPLCEEWFAYEHEDEDLLRITEPHVHSFIRANAWLVLGRDRDLLIDAGNGIASLGPVLRQLRPDPAKPLLALATHGHMDHIGGLPEFGDRLVHPEDEGLAARPDRLLWHDDVWPGARAQMAAVGHPIPSLLLSAVPRRSFDPASFRCPGTVPTRRVAEGDRIDLGNRSFEVLHLPGHTRGSVGLWDAARAVLFSGDAVYATDPLIDTAPTSDGPAYVTTMRRLRELPVETVHPGHDFSFGRATLVARCDAYLASHAEQQGPAPTHDTGRVKSTATR